MEVFKREGKVYVRFSNKFELSKENYDVVKNEILSKFGGEHTPTPASAPTEKTNLIITEGMTFTEAAKKEVNAANDRWPEGEGGGYHIKLKRALIQQALQGTVLVGESPMDMGILLRSVLRSNQPLNNRTFNGEITITGHVEKGPTEG